MSNDGEPNKKFAQTFFLAEQPNGYFVLNDTLRFLNLFDEEEQEAYEGEEEVVEEEPVEVTVEDATVEVEVKAEVISEEPVEVVVNGNGEVEVVNGEEETKEEEEPEVKEEEVAAPVEEEAVPEPEAPKEEEPAPVVEEAPAPEPVPEPAPAPKEEKPAPPPPPAVPAAPPKPKTWANLVAATTSTLKPVQNAVAAVVPGVPSTSTPEPKTDAALPPPKAEQPGVSMPAQKGAAAQAAAASQDGWTTAEKKHPKSAAAQGEQNPTLAFIRNVTEKVDAEALKAVLTKFGPLKQFEVSRQRVCRSSYPSLMKLTLFLELCLCRVLHPRCLQGCRRRQPPPRRRQHYQRRGAPLSHRCPGRTRLRRPWWLPDRWPRWTGPDWWSRRIWTW